MNIARSARETDLRKPKCRNWNHLSEAMNNSKRATSNLELKAADAERSGIQTAISQTTTQISGVESTGSESSSLSS